MTRTMSTARHRFPLLAPESLTPEQRAVYEAIANGPRGGGPLPIVDEAGHLTGPFNALMYVPALATQVQRLGVALRFEGTLPARTRELVICAVAAEVDSDYEWYAHRRMALEVGISSTELDGLRNGALLAGLSAAERSALRLAHALLRDHVVDDSVHAEVSADHGHEGLVEIAVLVGYYQLLAGVLAAADVRAPASD
ncbi:carboxymuconolactone decarboxylase family protein [Qaidamihabitans albus]|uniref:carboxymuconolactone decarboxylase family protein n=1 Tax=Qaidamihabitans albus TaxID=2795733 RepID=UPI0018F1C362|nr:carboxymuconolactone decarboxylase family protein [Qaidamihabitans albus]